MAAAVAAAVAAAAAAAAAAAVAAAVVVVVDGCHDRHEPGRYDQLLQQHTNEPPPPLPSLRVALFP